MNDCSPETLAHILFFALFCPWLGARRGTSPGDMSWPSWPSYSRKQRGLPLEPSHRRTSWESCVRRSVEVERKVCDTLTRVLNRAAFRTPQPPSTNITTSRILHLRRTLPRWRARPVSPQEPWQRAGCRPVCSQDSWASCSCRSAFEGGLVFLPAE